MRARAPVSLLLLLRPRPRPRPAEAAIEFYKILGSVNFLGNPLGLVRGVARDLRALVTEPGEEVLQDPLAAGVAAAAAARALVQNTAAALLDSAARITESAAKGVKAVHVPGQRTAATSSTARQPTDVVQGVRRGFKTFGSALLSAVTGIVKDPAAQARRGGLLGFGKGLGIGLVGIVTKPAAGALEALALNLRGLAASVNPTTAAGLRARLPRFLGDGRLLPYSAREAEGAARLWLLQQAEPTAAGQSYIYHVDVAAAVQLRASDLWTQEALATAALSSGGGRSSGHGDAGQAAAVGSARSGQATSDPSAVMVLTDDAKGYAVGGEELHSWLRAQPIGTAHHHGKGDASARGAAGSSSGRGATLGSFVPSELLDELQAVGTEHVDGAKARLAIAKLLATHHRLYPKASLAPTLDTGGVVASDVTEPPQEEHAGSSDAALASSAPAAQAEGAGATGGGPSSGVGMGAGAGAGGAAPAYSAPAPPASYSSAAAASSGGGTTAAPAALAPALAPAPAAAVDEKSVQLAVRKRRLGRLSFPRFPFTRQPDVLRSAAALREAGEGESADAGVEAGAGPAGTQAAGASASAQPTAQRKPPPFVLLVTDKALWLLHARTNRRLWSCELGVEGLLARSEAAAQQGPGKAANAIRSLLVRHADPLQALQTVAARNASASAGAGAGSASAGAGAVAGSAGPARGVGTQPGPSVAPVGSAVQVAGGRPTVAVPGGGSAAAGVSNSGSSGAGAAGGDEGLGAIGGEPLPPDAPGAAALAPSQSAAAARLQHLRLMSVRAVGPVLALAPHRLKRRGWVLACGSADDAAIAFKAITDACGACLPGPGDGESGDGGSGAAGTGAAAGAGGGSAGSGRSTGGFIDRTGILALEAAAARQASEEVHARREELRLARAAAQAGMHAAFPLSHYLRVLAIRRINVLGVAPAGVGPSASGGTSRPIAVTMELLLTDQSTVCSGSSGGVGAAAADFSQRSATQPVLRRIVSAPLQAVGRLLAKVPDTWLHTQPSVRTALQRMQALGKASSATDGAAEPDRLDALSALLDAVRCALQIEVPLQLQRAVSAIGKSSFVPGCCQCLPVPPGLMIMTSLSTMVRPYFLACRSRRLQGATTGF